MDVFCAFVHELRHAFGFLLLVVLAQRLAILLYLARDQVSVDEEVLVLFGFSFGHVSAGVHILDREERRIGIVLAIFLHLFLVLPALLSSIGECQEPVLVAAVRRSQAHTRPEPPQPPTVRPIPSIFRAMI